MIPRQRKPVAISAAPIHNGGSVRAGGGTCKRARIRRWTGNRWECVNRFIIVSLFGVCARRPDSGNGRASFGWFSGDAGRCRTALQMVRMTEEVFLKFLESI
jgi:hypothetical protein